MDATTSERYLYNTSIAVETPRYINKAIIEGLEMPE
jgi:hypothetical protein